MLVRWLPCTAPEPKNGPSKLARYILHRVAWTGPNVCASSEALPIDFPHFAVRGAARLLFTARIERAISQLFTRIQRGGWCGLHCAHRATTASSWGLCEHRDHASCLATPLPSSLVFLFTG